MESPSPATVDLAAEALPEHRQRLFLPAPEPLRPMLGTEASLSYLGPEASLSVAAPECTAQLSFRPHADGNGTASPAQPVNQAQAAVAAPNAVLKVRLW
jgi:hypothetical protein